MNDNPSSNDPKDKGLDSPAPEVLKVQSDSDSPAPDAAAASPARKVNLRLRHGTYRPSHKATFIGLGVVIAILAINAAVILFLMKGQEKNTTDVNLAGVTISPEVLDTLGVSRNPVGDSGTELVVNPNASFGGTVTIDGDVSIAGQVKLNAKLTGAEASLTNLEAGETALGQLNVNGDGTISNLNLRNDLTVVGTTRLQGPVVVSQLMTINNNMNISGNLSVGGVLSLGSFQTNILTIGGRIITRGSAPSVSPGPALGNNGTVSISGNDISGTVATNIGTGGGNGILAYVSYVNQYDITPHVVITTIGGGVGSAYVSRDSSGFSIGANGAMAPGGYAFDYIVMQ